MGCLEKTFCHKVKHTLLFATNNQHKIDEMQSVLGELVNLKTMKDAGIDIDIPEPYETLEANASEKARVIHSLTGADCFSEDTGLEVESLNGEPGVKSARYSGGRSFDDNITKLLTNLEGSVNRKAQFRAVLALILDGKEYIFEGISKGIIIADKRGKDGFGYDPVFVPDGSKKTFAEMELAEKNLYSHRRIAAEKLVLFLQQFT